MIEKLFDPTVLLQPLSKNQRSKVRCKRQIKESPWEQRNKTIHKYTPPEEVFEDINSIDAIDSLLDKIDSL